MAQISVLLGRTFSDAVVTAISCVMMTSIGFFLGWRIESGFFKTVEGFPLLPGFG